MTSEQLDQLAINTIRTLSMDAVQQARSGHPGTPMALAPLVYTLWNRVMRFDPQDPIWPNRDRRAVEWPCLDAALVCAAPHRNAGGECRL
jgi:transketolase